MIENIDELGKFFFYKSKPSEYSTPSFPDDCCTPINDGFEHRCPLCGRQQLYYVYTWLCPKCDWEVINELWYEYHVIKGDIESD